MEIHGLPPPSRRQYAEAAATSVLDRLLPLAAAQSVRAFGGYIQSMDENGRSHTALVHLAPTILSPKPRSANNGLQREGHSRLPVGGGIFFDCPLMM